MIRRVLKKSAHRLLSRSIQQHSIFSPAICNRSKLGITWYGEVLGGSMGFIAALRQADDKAAAVALNEKRQDQDLETAVRRRMRVHPQPAVPEKTELRPS